MEHVQGQGIGTRIMDLILERIGGCNVILYAKPGREGFYLKQGFRPMKTGLARFKRQEAMRDKGFTE